MTFVVVRERACPAGDHRQRRLRAIKRLDLGLLVEAEHRGVHGRIHVHAHHIDQFRFEVRIVRQLERVTTPRPQPSLAPQRSDDVFADTVANAERPGGPAFRLVVGHGVQRVVNDRFEDVGTDHRFAAPTPPDHT